MKKLFLSWLILLLCIDAHSQNVGINTNIPNTVLDVNGALALRGTALSLANADNNDVVLSGNSFFRITGPSAAFAVTGLMGGVDGKLITLYNATNFALTIKNLYAGSTPINQIKTLNGSDIIFGAGNSSVTLQYNSTDTKWIVIAQQGIKPTQTFNQSAVSVYGTASLSSSSQQTLIPGLTQTVTVPQNGDLYISSAGGLATTSTVATGFSVIDVYLLIDNFTLSYGGYHRVYAANTTGVVGVVGYWGLSVALTLAPGSHTISVVATGVSGSTATISGSNTSPLEGTLTVMILAK